MSSLPPVREQSNGGGGGGKEPKMNSLGEKDRSGGAAAVNNAESNYSFPQMDGGETESAPRNRSARRRKGSLYTPLSGFQLASTLDLSDEERKATQLKREVRLVRFICVVVHSSAHTRACTCSLSLPLSPSPSLSLPLFLSLLPPPSLSFFLPFFVAVLFYFIFKCCLPAPLGVHGFVVCGVCCAPNIHSEHAALVVSECTCDLFERYIKLSRFSPASL